MYQFDKQLLDTDNDGFANYSLVFASSLTSSEQNNPLTIVGTQGLYNEGSFAIAHTDESTYDSSGFTLALVPTENHPELIPEPSVTGLVFGGLALITMLSYRNLKK